MSFDFSDFKAIVYTIEDVLSMLDDPRISVSNEIISEQISTEDAPEDWIEIKLSFPLKNGYSEILLGDETGKINYYNNGELVKEVEFDDQNIGVMDSSFNLGMRAVIARDKQSNKTQSKVSLNNSNPKTELDRVRAELSGIN